MYGLEIKISRGRQSTRRGTDVNSGLGDLLELFEGDDVSGLVGVTMNARAKGDVGVDAAVAG